MVTSALTGEGKSTVAANLAVALARASRDVTLVDLNLRRPSLARSFGLRPEPGFTDVARGSATLEEALATIPAGVSDEGVPLGTAAGPRRRAAPAADEFQVTFALDAILHEVSGDSDLVIVDSPPLLGADDGVRLAGKVDAILLVARCGVLQRPALAELTRVLADSPAEKLGFVLTGAKLERKVAAAGRLSRPVADPPLGLFKGTPS